MAPPAAREADVMGGLLARILTEPPSGGRLPPERALALALGTSRPTLRRALGVLAGWRILEPHRGSGIRVRPRAEWSLSALPAWIACDPASPELRRLAGQALAMRRLLARQLPAWVGRDLAPGALDAARRAADAAYEARGAPAPFVRADARVVGSLLGAAGALPAAWSWNDFSAVAVALADRLPALAVAGDYAATLAHALSALERGDGRAASRALATHLARLDRELLRALPPSGSRA